MPPPFKAGLLSFLGQLGIETQQGFNCGLSGWGVLLLLRANPVGSSWLRDLEGTGQLCPAGTSMVLSLAIGGLPSAEDSLPLLASRGKPSAFSKTSLNIWKFTVHVLLKPGLENFEHYFTSMR